VKQTVADVLRRATGVLRQAGVDNPGFEARLLLAHVLDVPHAALLDRNVAIDTAGLDALLARRTAREPVARILSRQGFWTLELGLSPETLIPRADSETLIEAALDAFSDRSAVGRVLDLGTGSGALLLAALTEFPAAWGIGIDRSPGAAAQARRNANANALAARALMLCGNWADCLTGRFDLILANPPYIESQSIPALMPEVAHHEPLLALDGGPDGLHAYRAIIPALPGLLAPGGAAVLEIGHSQAAPIIALAQASGFESPRICADLGGLQRALLLREPSSAKKQFGSRRAGG
jgi:release factor glutamine methyltransferase